jgi:hypothetical protein
MAIDSGFRLVVELLATGKPVALRPAPVGKGHETTPNDASAARMQRSPTGAYTPGPGTGSTVTLQAGVMGNEETLGTDRGRTLMIDQDPTATVGHELIHALHNARGENLSPTLSPAVLGGLFGGATLVRDPITGGAESPEEMRTMTGQSSFAEIQSGGRPDRPVSYPLSGGASENALRADLGLPARASHTGVSPATISIELRGARTLADILGRYRVRGAILPATAADAIRSLLIARGIPESWPAGISSLSVPTPQLVLMHIRFVLGNAVLADGLEGLEIR